MSAKETDRFAVITSLIHKQINGTEAAEQLRLTTRQVRRLKYRVKKHGPQGLIHRGRGRVSNRKLEASKVDAVLKLLRGKYAGFGPTFAAEKLLERNQIVVSNETIRTLMIVNHLWKGKSRKQNQEHRTWRPRKDHYGAMQQYDGCYHRWFENRAEECCLLLSVDDATGKITKAWFDYHEGVVPTFHFWKDYLREKGKPGAIYLDKFSTYKINHQAAQDNKDMITQFQRACLNLGIELITAHSPEGKGRVERMFETLQDRLVKEMRLENISDIESANAFLKEKFIPAFNEKFAVVAAQQADVHRALTELDTKNMMSIFSVHSTRVVMNDFTVQFKNQYFQLDQQQPLTVCRKDTVRIEEHLDGTIKLKLREKELCYMVLPKRPEKEFTLRIPALVTSRPLYRPPANHPWRRQILMNKINSPAAR